MYMTQDAYQWWACIYFVAVLVLCQWIVLNLAIAVIADAYNDVMEEIAEKEKVRRVEARKALQEKARLAKLRKQRKKSLGGPGGRSSPTMEEAIVEKPLTKVEKLKKLIIPQPWTKEQAEKRAPLTRLVKGRPFQYFCISNHTDESDRTVAHSPSLIPFVAGTFSAFSSSPIRSR